MKLSTLILPLVLSVAGCSTTRKHPVQLPPSPPGMAATSSFRFMEKSKDISTSAKQSRMVAPSSIKQSFAGGGLVAQLDWQANQSVEFCQAVNISTSNTNKPGPLVWSYNPVNHFIHLECPIESGMEIWFVITTYVSEQL